MRDTVIIGAGHNGLIAAAFLAKGGLKPLVLERTERVGGCAITSELAAGFKCSTLAHRAAIDPEIVQALDLERRGLRIIRPRALAFAPAADGRALTLWSDPALAARDIAAFSARDAEKYPEFLRSVSAVSGVLRSVLSVEPPSIDKPGPGDVFHLFRTGTRFRALGRKDAYRLLRWLPMPVADFAREWFESEPLLATVAASGVLGSFLGVRSAGSAAILLLLAAADTQPVAPGWGVAGGMGEVSKTLAEAARDAGAEIRVGTTVRSISVKDGSATGVVLESGEEIASRTIVSSADPRRTFLTLLDRTHLAPDFVRRIENIRMRGALAKVNYAVSALPAFAGAPGDTEGALSGCVRLAHSLDVIERAFDAAKYGGIAQEPWIELTVPSLTDPSLAPPGQHVVSAYVQFAPYGLRDASWDVERERLGDIATGTISRFAPGFDRSIIAREVIAPPDLERVYGLTGGNIFHGELALDQLFVARPLLGWARHETPIRNLYLCGSGTHPGTGLDGRAGRLAAGQILRRS